MKTGLKINTKGSSKNFARYFTLLKKAYPGAKCSLNFKTPLEMLVATILSAQCTDERVNKVTADLFKKYKKAEDYAGASAQILQNDIHSTGFFRNKAKSIQGACKMIVKDFDGNIPRTMEEIIKLPGVARKTGNVVLGNCYGVTEGITVDTHVRRLSQRLGLTKEDIPEKIEQDLMKIVPPGEWMKISYLLIDHGRKICKAIKPKCGECVLKELCPSAGKV
jgi:endonuclease-3